VSGGLSCELGVDRPCATRRDVKDGYEGFEGKLEREGQRHLANLVRRFAERMPTPMTERQWIAKEMRHTGVTEKHQPDRSPFSR